MKYLFTILLCNLINIQVIGQVWQYFEEENFEGIIKAAGVFDSTKKYFFSINNRPCGGYSSCGIVNMMPYPELVKEEAKLAMNIWVRFKGSNKKYLLDPFEIQVTEDYASIFFFYQDPNSNSFNNALYGIDPNTKFYELLKSNSEMYIRIEFESNYESNIHFDDLIFSLNGSSQAINKVLSE
ncbi:MAG: hypothetical protein ACOCWM_00430 [Cyclobacteriaceae bacterium]